MAINMETGLTENGESYADLTYTDDEPREYEEENE